MSEIQLDTQGGIATITLAAPERRNALTEPMAQALNSVCDDLDNDLSIGAVIIRGEGGTFCAGADRALLSAIKEDPLSDKSLFSLESIYRAFRRVSQLAMPTIASVRGAAVGAGVNLMLSTDLRVVSRTARIIPGFAAAGLHPGGGHFTLLDRVGGREVCAGLGLFGAEIDGARAFDLGMAWDVADDSQVDRQAATLAARHGADPELARAATRSFRLEAGPPTLPLTVASEVERAPQIWSFSRTTV